MSNVFITDTIVPCSQPENINLFSSKYVEPFSSPDFKEDNPSATPEELEAAKKEHDATYLATREIARDICATCPVLEQCRDWVLSTTEPVYGITAGMTRREQGQTRRYLKK